MFRYQKCLRQGMLRECVRLDRVRGGRQKYMRYPLETTHGSVQTNKKIMLEENKVLESLSQCEPEQLISLSDPSLPSFSFKTLSTLSDIYDRELVGTIGWAKQVDFKFD
jgi:estrogen-related receptor ERR